MKIRTSRLVLSGVLLAATFLLVTNCDEFVLTDEFYQYSGMPLAIYPAVAAVQSSGSLEFVATGGASGYSFQIAEPGGGTIDPISGVYTAPVTVVSLPSRSRTRPETRDRR